MLIYFNPRLREGGDLFLMLLRFFKVISIHASAKEATQCAEEIYLRLDISIHASAKEATMINCRPVSSYDISIHASAKEATYLCYNKDKLRDNFNPRLREGGDFYIGINSIIILISIHASAKEATQVLLMQEEHIIFQSTPPRRRRQGH